MVTTRSQARASAKSHITTTRPREPSLAKRSHRRARRASKKRAKRHALSKRKAAAQRPRAKLSASSKNATAHQRVSSATTTVSRREASKKRVKQCTDSKIPNGAGFERTLGKLRRVEIQLVCGMFHFSELRALPVVNKATRDRVRQYLRALTSLAISKKAMIRGCCYFQSDMWCTIFAQLGALYPTRAPDRLLGKGKQWTEALPALNHRLPILGADSLVSVTGVCHPDTFVRLTQHPRAAQLKTLTFVTNDEQKHLPLAFEHFSGLTALGICALPSYRTISGVKYDALYSLGRLRGLQHLQLKLVQPFTSTEAPRFAKNQVPWNKLSRRLRSLVLHARLPEVKFQFPVLDTLYVWGFTAGCAKMSLQQCPALEELAVFEEPDKATVVALKHRDLCPKLRKVWCGSSGANVEAIRQCRANVEIAAPMMPAKWTDFFAEHKLVTRAGAVHY